MSKMDKAVGRAKQRVGDVVDDASLRREGRKQEEKGEKKEEAARAEERAEAKAQEAADLERGVNPDLRDDRVRRDV